jgi:hypothetical protein
MSSEETLLARSGSRHRDDNDQQDGTEQSGSAAKQQYFAQQIGAHQIFIGAFHSRKNHSERNSTLSEQAMRLKNKNADAGPYLPLALSTDSLTWFRNTVQNGSVFPIQNGTLQAKPTGLAGRTVQNSSLSGGHWTYNLLL